MKGREYAWRAVVINETTFRSLDALRLCGTLVVPAEPTANATVLVHGGGANRDEGGFFVRLAYGMAEAGIPSLRFDFRGHGDSGASLAVRAGPGSPSGTGQSGGLSHIRDGDWPCGYRRRGLRRHGHPVRRSSQGLA